MLIWCGFARIFLQRLAQGRDRLGELLRPVLARPERLEDCARIPPMRQTCAADLGKPGIDFRELKKRPVTVYIIPT